jgi:hypothetical protein
MESSAALKFSVSVQPLEEHPNASLFLEHLQRQSHKNFELIVVDQSADDRLLALIEPYRCCFPVVRLARIYLHCVALVGKWTAN